MDLLLQLYCINAKSGNEATMVEFISTYVKTMFPEATVTEDNGNLYVTKGEAEYYPCVVAHTDEVHAYNPSLTVLHVDNHIFGYDLDAGKTSGIGADDKNGIWVALKMLEKVDAIKLAFFRGEEIGCVGSGKANMNFFENCMYVIQCDRRNSGDFITSAGAVELCSDEFYKDSNPEQFGYKKCTGMMTDVQTLKRNGLKVSSCNLSCGYYNPHTRDEFTRFEELENCLSFVEHIITTMTKPYPHTYTASVYSYNKDTKNEVVRTEEDYKKMWEEYRKKYKDEEFDFDFDGAIYY